MRGFCIKAGLALAGWYEVSVELGLGGGAALVVTLLTLAAGLTLLRLPGEVAVRLGPAVTVVIGPIAVWFGLAWWLMPGVTATYPMLALAGLALLALVGAGAHYTVSRYPARAAPLWPMLRAGIVPATCLALGLADQFAARLLSLPVCATLLAMPICLGWRFIGPAVRDGVDAKFGDADGLGER
jgi:hypothetical protein